MTRPRLATAALLTFAICFVSQATAHGETPFSQEMVKIDRQDVAIPAPILSPAMDQSEQRAKIESAIGGLSYRQFIRDSAVAPVRIKLSYIKDASGNRIGHSVHVFAIVHASVDDFRSDKFRQQILLADADGSKAIGEDELKRSGITTLIKGRDYRRVEFDLLDKIHLNAVILVRTIESQKQQRIDLKIADEFESRWNMLDDKDVGATYSGFQGWVTVTALAEHDDQAVLMESRLVFAEPKDWFRGSNFLRSKLPIALQESVRKLRRKLKAGH